jgi:hypothetical protein
MRKRSVGGRPVSNTPTSTSLYGEFDVDGDFGLDGVGLGPLEPGGECGGAVMAVGYPVRACARKT